MVGTIDPRCEVTPIVKEAYENARFLCEQCYLSSPEMVYTSYDSTASSFAGVAEIGREGMDDSVSLVYVPAHVYHIFFELFKNAMRATIEHAGEDAHKYQPIKGKRTKIKSFAFREDSYVSPEIWGDLRTFS